MKVLLIHLELDKTLYTNELIGLRLVHEIECAVGQSVAMVRLRMGRCRLRMR